MTETYRNGDGRTHEADDSGTPALGQPVADQPAADQPTAEQPSLSAALGQSLASAARRSGIGTLAEDETPTGRAMLQALGGVRGLAETILPGLVFLVLYTFTKNVPISLAASVAVAAVFTIVRLIGRTPVTQAVAGLIGVGASAILALITGRGEDNFVPGLITNAVFALALLISMLVRWPLIGLVAGFLMDQGTAWREHKGPMRVMQLITFVWVLMFVARLAVEFPLYLAGNIEALAIAKLLMGIPLYAPLLLLTWLAVRAVFGKRTEAPGSD
ncbi:DUF3159 domain-containing protein [Microbacterium sp. STN6]|uniref:DUF3159 domain-containing protein n=1 Tax=Microbacterium sp. STN6 TaxID=2995588 RepID=UPI002260A816|nr:DUF3159 domain-containing protein [Microbacterium sp. STN6]MCX7522444.1 DUF3159 domain-containing protein [Microbacterium sp. STN6]